MTILSAGGGSPITPVEEMKTCFGSHPSRRAVVAAVASTTSLPVRPVKVFELPELTTMPRALPPARHSRHHETGAPVAARQEESSAEESGQFGAGIL